jgi:hypothetical protein
MAGHDCYAVAVPAIVYNALGRLSDDATTQRLFSTCGTLIYSPGSGCVRRWHCAKIPVGGRVGAGGACARVAK